MTIQMYDAVPYLNIPVTSQAVAGYVDGDYLTYWRVVARCPNALHLSIAVFAENDAECLDIERGNATPPEAPEWVQRQLARGVHRPVIYAQVSTMPTIVSLLEARGIPTSAVRFWTAHYNGVPHFCRGELCGYGLQIQADATQWTDRALGVTLDESVCADTFFGSPLPPPDPNHYDRYPVGPFPFREPSGAIVELNERATVEEYDNLRSHPQLNAKRLDELRTLLTFLRKRVWYVAHYNTQTQSLGPTADWASYHRGWRWQMLLARSRGEVVAR